jgi:hypothetical protein
MRMALLRASVQRTRQGVEEVLIMEEVLKAESSGTGQAAKVGGYNLFTACARQTANGGGQARKR